MKLLSNMPMHLRDTLLLALITLMVSLPGLSTLTVIDRDEARYAQATVQMLETHDYVDIRFQGDPRWKKPAGAYWAQALSLKAANLVGLSDLETRAIWLHRLPSVLAAILAVLATYLGGARLFGRNAALIGAALFAVSFSMTFEAHIAKTDALLAACAASMLAALSYLRIDTDSAPQKAGRRTALIFWIALGLGTLIKGPILPTLIVPTLVLLIVWERKLAWLKPLCFWLGPLLFLLITLPWAYLIYEKTGGDFFRVAVGEDLTPKLKGGAEKHGGPIGYYALTVWFMFWPGIAFLLAGLAFAWKAIKSNSPYAIASRLLICWALPWWVITELTPTKLPHYTLPVYPALALLAGAAAARYITGAEYTLTRRIGAALYAFIGVLLAIGAVYAADLYGPPPSWAIAFAIMISALILCSAILLWKGKNARTRAVSLVGIVLSAIGLHAMVFGSILPNAGQLTVSKNFAAMLKSEGYELPFHKDQAVLSPTFTEPSLVYYLGTHIQLGGHANLDRLNAAPLGTLLIIDDFHKKSDAIRSQIETQSICLDTLGYVDGENYSKGDTVRLIAFKKVTCL